LGLPEYNELQAKGDLGASHMCYQETSYIGRELVRRAAAGSYNLSYDGTGDSALKQLGEKVKWLRAGGGKVVAHYVSLDVEEAVRRNEARAKQPGPDFGRKVPEAALREIHAKVSEIVPAAIQAGLYDQFTLHDNDGPKPVLVATAEGKNLMVHHPELWQKFVAKGKTMEKAPQPERLTVDEVNTLMSDELAGRKQTITGPAADRFLVAFRRDVEQADRDGISLKPLVEWPDP
jgi:hypothetical protein